jgi:polyisoprenoid-binding protein YceI
MIRVKIIACCLFFLLGLSAYSQKRFTTDKGEMTFTSNAKLEVIKASSNKIQGLLDPANGQFAFVVKVQSFEGFNSNLQKEHFNEKYMESEKFYDATFTGKIIEAIDYTQDGTYDVRAKGTLTIHGKKQPRIIPGKLKIEKGTLRIESNFTVPMADHDIKVPQIVSEKIATEIFVKLNVAMVQK